MPAKRPRLSAARKAAGHTQESLAEALGVDRSTVVRWEAGETAPQPWVRPKLARLLEVTGSELTEFLGTGVATSQLPSVASSSVFSDATAAPHHLAPVAESVELLRHIEASDLGPGTLDQMEELVECLGFDYFAVPPAEFRTSLLSWRRYVARLLNGKLTLAQRRRLYAVAGWLSGLLAEVSLALGEQAAPHCVTALSLAHECGDLRLAGWVLGTRAQIALYTGDPRDSVAFAQAASKIAPLCSAALFRSYALEGRAHARSGDPAGSESAFANAEQTLAGRLDSCPGSFWSFDAPYLPYYAGTAYVWLDKPVLARERATEAIALCDASTRAWPVARTSARVDLATALISLGERAEAALVGAEAVAIWSERPTYPAKKRINDLIALFQPLEDSSSRELLEQWSWTST